MNGVSRHINSLIKFMVGPITFVKRGLRIYL